MKNAAFQQRADERLSDLFQELAPYLSNETVTDVIINPNQHGFVHYVTGRKHLEFVMDEARTWALIMTVASLLNRTVTPQSPTLAGRIPGSPHRIQIAIPPVTTGPFVAIRCHNTAVRSLSSYVEQGVITAEHLTMLRQAVVERKNIVVAGATGSGKTTFLNALLGDIATYQPHDRIVTLEDTPEIQVSSENVTQLYTSPSVSMQELVALSLRTQPTRIIVGETRGKEAWDLIKAWTTGHEGGLTTVHAKNGIEETLERLQDMASEAGVTVSRVRLVRLIDLIVFLSTDGQTRTCTMYETYGKESSR